MQTIAELLAELPVLAGLAADHRETIAGCARTAVFEPGQHLMREGEAADSFFVIRRGTVAIETFVPQRGAVTLQTLHDGDLLGWSWLFPPYVTAFDARALESVHALHFDGACLRGKCEQDPALGYSLLRLFAGVMVQRLAHARMQLLDLYGSASRS